MHPTSKKFVNKTKEEFGFKPEIFEFPRGTKTAEDAAKAIDCKLGQIAKSIVMKAGNKIIIVLTSGSNRVSEKKLADKIGVKENEVRTANAEKVKAKTGWSIGGVPPFCHKDDTKVLMDKDLMQYDEVWAAGGTPKAVFPISPKKLKECSGAEVADIKES